MLAVQLCDWIPGKCPELLIGLAPSKATKGGTFRGNYHGQNIRKVYLGTNNKPEDFSLYLPEGSSSSQKLIGLLG